MTTVDFKMKSIVAFFTVVLVLFYTNFASAESIRVTLLGSGGPSTSPTHFGASTLVEAGKEKLVFDVGRGAIIRLEQINTPLSNITVFLTHLHSDHMNGLSDLWSVSYITHTFRQTPLEIYGPSGIVNVTSGIQTAYKSDIDIRSSEYAAKGIDFYPSGATFNATEVKQEGEILNRGGVKVTAIKVEHGAGISFAYRVDYAGRSVVISGDTNLSKNLMKKSKGVDLIIHEVNPKMAVFNHLILVGVTPEMLEMRTRKTYSGPLMIGQDLMTFNIDDTVSIINR